MWYAYEYGYRYNRVFSSSTEHAARARAENADVAASTIKAAAVFTNTTQTTFNPLNSSLLTPCLSSGTAT